MKKTHTIHYLLLLGYTLKAQQSSIVGTVAVFNSKTETGKRQFIQYAQVEETLGNSQATTTDADGNFRLVLVGIAAKESFEFTATKAGYEIVNKDNLHAVAGQREAVTILMSPKGKIAESKIKYYKIGKTASEKSLDAKIKQKQADLAVLKKNEKANQQAINDTQAEIAKLYEYYKTIDQNARELAERFSRVNLDDASDLYQRAFRHFQNGSIDSALIVLDEVNWSNKVDSILIEEARLFALKSVIDYNDSVFTAFKQAVQTNIDIRMSRQEHQEAIKIFKLLFDLDANNTDALLQDYHQITRIAILAQDYPLAKLYVQEGLKLNQDDVGLHLLDIYTLTLNEEKQAAETALNKLVLDKDKRDKWVANDLNFFKTHGLSEADSLKLRQIFNQ